MENPNQNNPFGTPPEAARTGLAEIYERLTNLSENLGGGCTCEEVESIARAVAKVEAEMKAGNLSAVFTGNLIEELHKRKSGSGDMEPCVLIAVTPSDLSDYWGSDDNGNPLPTNVPPTPEAWSMAVRAFNRWEDGGAFTELMEVMGDAWAAHEKKKGESK